MVKYTPMPLIAASLVVLVKYARCQCNGTAKALEITLLETYVIETPGFPNGYDRSLTCVWTVDVSTSRHVILLQAVKADLGCPGDGITAKDNVFGIKPLDNYCDSGQASTRIFSIKSGRGSFTFKTDTVIKSTEKGSRILLYRLPKSNETTCQSSSVLQAKENQETIFFSPNFPFAYPTDVFCKWTIEVPPTYVVRLTLYFHDLEEDTSNLCSNNYDYLEVKTVSNLLIKTCKPWSFSSTTASTYTAKENVTITLKSDDSTNHRGFMIGYVAIPDGLGVNSTATTTTENVSTPTTVSSTTVRTTMTSTTTMTTSPSDSIETTSTEALTTESTIETTVDVTTTVIQSTDSPSKSTSEASSSTTETFSSTIDTSTTSITEASTSTAKASTTSTTEAPTTSTTEASISHKTSTVSSAETFNSTIDTSMTSKKSTILTTTEKSTSLPSTTSITQSSTSNASTTENSSTEASTTTVTSKSTINEVSSKSVETTETDSTPSTLTSTAESTTNSPSNTADTSINPITYFVVFFVFILIVALIITYMINCKR